MHVGTGVTPSPFIGCVFVVAGSAPVFGVVADALTAAGAAVALVGTATTTTDPAARFRADPGDADVWGRVVPHVEQRLGPIDGVVAGAEGRDIAEMLVAPDLARRGHGAVLAIADDADVSVVLTTLAGTL
jgi:hypothetical protein